MNLTYNKIQYALKELAKTIRYQNEYSLFKEGIICLFENKKLTSLQREFISLLSFYYNIYVDVAAGEVSDKVLENDIRMEAYSVYKNKKFRDQKKKVEKENLVNKKGRKQTSQTVSSKTYKFRPSKRNR